MNALTFSSGMKQDQACMSEKTGASSGNKQISLLSARKSPAKLNLGFSPVCKDCSGNGSFEEDLESCCKICYRNDQFN